MLIFINTDWNKRFRRIESTLIDVRLQRCQQMILSKCCLTKTRRIFEAVSSDRHHSFDQSKKTISLSIEMLNWESMLKDKWSDAMIKVEMIRWNNHYVIKLINLFEKEKKFRWVNHLIDQLIFYFITSSFNSSCMNDSTSNRIYLFETIRIVDFSSICWLRIELFYNHSIDMIFFKFIDFRDRREINEFEDEYAILMKSDRNDNEKRR
jgi:hypothetical protein